MGQSIGAGGETPEQTPQKESYFKSIWEELKVTNLKPSH